VNAAVLTMVTDLQAQLDSMTPRVERLEKRLEAGFVESIAEMAADAAIEHQGLRSICS
jgi:hypothetical protein